MSVKYKSGQQNNYHQIAFSDCRLKILLLFLKQQKVKMSNMEEKAAKQGLKAIYADASKEKAKQIITFICFKQK